MKRIEPIISEQLKSNVQSHAFDGRFPTEGLSYRWGNSLILHQLSMALSFKSYSGRKVGRGILKLRGGSRTPPYEGGRGDLDFDI